MGTKSFVFVISNFVAPVAEEITQSSDQVTIILISQLINGISRVLQKLLKYFNGTAISTPLLPGAGVFIYLTIIYFTYVVSECTIFKNYSFNSFI